MKNQIGLWGLVFLAACDARVSVGYLGASSGGSAGSKPNGELPTAEAGAPADAPTGEASAGGAGLAGQDGETGGSSAESGGSSGSSGSSAGSGGSSPLAPYAPRSGSFKMLAYSATKAYRHDGSIVAGRSLLRQIADEQGFDLVTTEENGFLSDIASFEIVFFMNPSGDIFNEQEQQVFQQWMTSGGAFAGTHSATETEAGWPFYAEVTGQFYDGHGPQNVTNDVELAPALLDHPALQGLPNPWQRAEEWFRFNSHPAWSAKPGFQILARNAADGQPVSWLREWGTFRAFYTSLGHDGEAFADPLIKKHLTGGIMWAVRREHLIK